VTDRWSRAALLAAALGLAPWIAPSVGADEPPTPGPPAVAENPAGDSAAPEGDPAKAAKIFDEAEAAREEGRWSEAADLFWKAIKADASHFRAHVRYQESCAAAGDDASRLLKDYDGFVADYPTVAAFKLHRLRLDRPVDRLSALEALRRAGPVDGDLLLEIGRAQLAAGNPAEALKPLSDALGMLPPERTDALVLLAKAEIASGRAADAQKRVEKALAALPGFFDGHLLLARIHFAAGRFDMACAESGKVLEARPLHLAATLYKGEALSRLGKRDDAIATLEAALRVAGKSPELRTAIGDLSAQIETEIGWAKASDQYAEAVKASDGYPRAHYGMGWVLERQGKYKEAEEKYRAVLAAIPDAPTAVHSVGFCLFRQGRITEAQVQFKKALDLDAEFVPAYLDLGATYDAQADYNQAIKWYEKLLRKKGHEHNFRALVNLAFDYEHLGAFPKAEDYLKQAQKLRPQDVDVLVWLGDNSYFQEKWKDAAAYYQRAIGLDDKSFFGWRGLGFAMAHQKRWADAVQALEQAKTLRPTDKDVLLALGDIYLSELKDLESALAAYEAYVAAGGDDPDVPALIEEIRKELGK
jgi:tetratricopeptide (TPR) repeat protein